MSILDDFLCLCNLKKNIKIVSCFRIFENFQKAKISLEKTLEDTACYAGLLLCPAEGQGLFLPLGQKKNSIRLFWPNLGHFWCPVVTLVSFSSLPVRFKV